MSDLVALFAYGTLRDEAVQLACFGRRLEGVPDWLHGYRKSYLPPQPDASGRLVRYPVLDPAPGDAEPIAGTLFRVSRADLKAADLYEGDEYRRIEATLRGGKTAWVYIRALEAV